MDTFPDRTASELYYRLFLGTRHILWSVECDPSIAYPFGYGIRVTGAIEINGDRYRFQQYIGSEITERGIDFIFMVVKDRFMRGLRNEFLIEPVPVAPSNEYARIGDQTKELFADG